jgi:signal transduction histidine kinase
MTHLEYDRQRETLLCRVDIRYERDVVLVRQRARQIAALLGFDAQEQTRVATGVSEIARNAFEYAGGGRAAFLVEQHRHAAFLVRITDEGPGIADLAAVLEGRYESPTGMGLGIVGARRLVDRFDISSSAPGGTMVTLGKLLPPGVAPVTADRIAAITQALAAAAPGDPVAELQARNHELLRALDEVRARQNEVERLNAELAETNRGVLALYAELDDRALQLARASELKSNFLSSISHELRTPLNAIHNLTRLLLDRLDGDLTAEQERQVSMVRSAAVTLTDMVNDLLDLARIEAGKTVLRLAEFAVADLLGAVRGMLRPLVISDAVVLAVEPPEGEWRMYSDEGKVSQVLRNLVSNAVKFTVEGEIRVAASLDADGDCVVFAVSDTGIGIPAEDVDRIFEEYAQVDSYLQRQSNGTGLGLPLSRKLAHLLGGTLTAESTPGRGSVFTLRLPRVYDAVPGACPGGAEPDAVPPAEVQHA